MTKKQFNEFTNQYPNIAKILENPEILTKDMKLMEKVQLDSWQTTALLIMGHIWKCKGANVFHNPVNPEKLGNKVNARNS